jgi:hypothetical protein
MLVGALVVLLLPGAVSTETSDWAWLRATSTGTSWWTTDGRANVVMSERRFGATLWDSDDPTFVRITLRGSTTNAITTARVWVEATDSGEFDVSGRLKRLCWKDGDGREVLILTNGIGVIGLVRELTASDRCSPL